METRRQAKRNNDQVENDTGEQQRSSKRSKVNRDANNTELSTNSARISAHQQQQENLPSTSNSRGRRAARGVRTTTATGRNQASAVTDQQTTAGGVFQSVLDRLSRRRNSTINMSQRDANTSEQDQEGEGNRSNRAGPSPPSSIQSLLTRFGANLEDIMPRMGHHGQHGGIASGSRMKEIINGLKSEDDGVQLASLTQLVEMLSMASDDMVAGFPSDQIVPLLLQFADAEANDALVEHSLRAFTYMCEMVPSACTQVIRENGTSIIVARALDAMNGYIDIAELALQVILHLSKEHPQSCLQNGGINAALAYIDFFPIGIQRKSMMSVANMCRGMDEGGTAIALEQLDKMIMLMDSPDAQMLEYISQALLRIIESCKNRLQMLEQIASETFISAILAVISKRDSGNTSATVLVNIFRMLGLMAAGAVNITHRLLQGDIVPVLSEAFSASPMLSSSGSSSGLIRSAENLYEGLNLANALLPALPSSSQGTSHPGLAAEQQAMVLMLAEPGTSQESQSNETSQRLAQHRELLQKEPLFLTQFVTEMIPVLIKIQESGAIHKVSWRCLDIVTKVVCYSSKDVLEAGGLAENDISAFVASLLNTGSQDLRSQGNGLIIAELLLQKMPDVFKGAFQRQGVLYSIKQLASSTGESHSAVRTRSKAKQEEKQRQRLKELSQSKNTPPPELLKPLLAQRAKDILYTHFPAGDLAQLDAFTSETMRKLKSIADALVSVQPGDVQDDVVQALLGTLAEEDVSTFELLSSGVVQSLIKYLQEDTDEQMVIRRLECLVRCENEQLLGKFVSRLVGAISSLDRFPVVSDSRMYTSSDSLVRFANKLSKSFELLHSQVAKIKFVKDPTETMLKDFSERVTSWQMSASISQLERFVYPRVKLDENEMQQIQSARSAQNERSPIVTRSKSQKSDTEHSTEESKTQTKESTSKPLPIPQIPASDKQPSSSNAQSERQRESGSEAAQPGPSESEPRQEGEDSGNILQALDSLAAVGDFVEEFLQEAQYREGRVAEMMQRRLRFRFGEDVEVDEEDEDMENEDDVDEDMDDHDDDDGLSYDEMEESYEDDDLELDTPHTRSTDTNLRFALASRVNPFNITSSSSPSSSQPPLNQLVFLLDGKVVPPDVTLQRALRDVSEGSSTSNISGQMAQIRRMMERVYTLTYRLRTPEDELVSNQSHEIQLKSGPSEGLVSLVNIDSNRAREVLNLKVAADLDAYTELKPILNLLIIIDWVVRESGNFSSVFQGNVQLPMKTLVPKSTFISHSVCSKVQQQLKDMLSVSYIQEWCGSLMACCKFLFTFELRQKYFNCTAFSRVHMHDFLRTLNAQSSSTSRGGAEPSERGLRVKKARLRISRDKILNSAYKIFEEHAAGNRTIEIEYFGEQGIGLGPTQEFFTLLSKELLRKDLGLWREEYRNWSNDKDGVVLDINVPDSNQNNQQDFDYRHVYAPFGLFPRPLLPNKQAEEKSVMQGFRLLGQLVAKALMDRRLLDLPLNRVFWKVVLGKMIDIHDVQEVDPNLGKSLLRMWDAYKKARADASDVVLLDGVRVEDLCCTWVLPGNDEYELCESGTSRLVDSGNLEEYIQSVVRAVLVDGVHGQINAFRKGFDQVFSLDSLKLFYEDEIDILLCGCGERWSVDSLQTSVQFDHGYTASSKHIKWLLEVMEGFTMLEQRKFLSFITGCPRLPPGGLQNLYPRLTVVRKQSMFSDTGNSPLSTPASEEGKFGMSGMYDHDLPSVMTCAHYLKLPPYSSKDVLKKRLLFAITEGQGSFDLS